MNRILVIGCGGAGKSTFSQRLANLSGKPLINFDAYYWKPNWIETSRDEWKKIVMDLCTKPEWIIDGNYINTLEMRIAFADTIFFLDFNTGTCLAGAFKRVVFRKRPDKIEGCKEKIYFDFIKWILEFKSKVKPRIESLLSKVDSNKRVVVFKNRRDAQSYLKKEQG